MAESPGYNFARFKPALEHKKLRSPTPLRFEANPAGRTVVMGILNVTPDSFSDGGVHTTVDAAMSKAETMVSEGADWIDIGGESTRPGSQPVPEAEQIRRVAPVIGSIAQRGWPVNISIDTTRAAVAAAALDAGASIVNDISAGLDDPALLPLVADRHAQIILMHMQGTPATMQRNPQYSDVSVEIIQFLLQRADFAQSQGIRKADIWLDTGIGFGKTVEHNLQLLRDLPKLVATGYPIVVGSSRKGFIGKITGETDPANRQFGTAATVAWAAAAGAAVVRVHDVAEMSRVVRMIDAIRSPRTVPVATV